MSEQALAMLGKHPTREQLAALEARISECPQTEMPVTHHFADGVYGRELFIPAGTVLTGKTHRFATMNLLMHGEITVSTPDGMRRLTAPAIFTSVPGCKKAGYAHTDTIWVNIHPTKLRDLAAIESKFIEPETPATISEGFVWLG